MYTQLKKYWGWGTSLLFDPNRFFAESFSENSSRDSSMDSSRSESQLRFFAFSILALSSLSWAAGLYLLRPSYSSLFWIQILSAAFMQFLVVFLGGILLSPYMDHSIRKRYTEKSAPSPKKLEILWPLSSLPWLFFTGLCFIIRDTSASSFFYLLIFLWLGSWSFALFLLGSQQFYGLKLRQLCAITFRTFGLFIFFPIFLFSWFILQVSPMITG